MPTLVVMHLRALLGAAVMVCACASAGKPSQPSNSLPAPPTEKAPVAPQSPVDAGAVSNSETHSPEATPSPRACDMFAQPGVLKRVALVRLLDAGLARWLRGVEGDRALAKHRFQGWLVKSIYPGDPCYQGLDLRAGDIVQRINGKSIEKPEQAFDVAESLRTASALVVEYLRDGKARQLSIVIADQP